MKVAVVYNRESQNVINLFGQPNKERIGLKTIKRITDALKEGKHQVRTFEADKDLVNRLEDFMPRVLHGERPGMVFNLSYGIQGQARYTHVPSILEMVGIPYVGSGPLAHSIALDKVVTKVVLVQNNIPTPDFAVLESPDFEAPGLEYPLIVKPKHEAVSFGIRVVNDEDELREAAGLIFQMFGQAVLVEQFIDGREINVGLLGNGRPDVLPVVELVFDEGPRVYSYEDKTGRSGRTIKPVCPAPLDPEISAKAQDLARRTFTVVGCSDCSRVDMRIDADGNLYVLEINSIPAMGEHASYVFAAEKAGLSFTQLANRLVEVASARYFGTPKPPQIAGKAKDPGTSVFQYVTEQRDRIERRLSTWTHRISRTSDPIGLQNATREIEKVLTDVGMKPVNDLSSEQSVTTWETLAGLDGGTLLIAHLDVPLDPSIAVQGFRREPEWLHGEGVGSSRAPIVMTEYALRALRHVRLLRKRKIGILFYMDEGRDRRASQPVLRSAMGRAKQTLVLRPGNVGDAVIDQRRGQRKYRLTLEGRPLRPGKARRQDEALLWFSRRQVELSALNAREKRISVSVTNVRSEAFPMLLPHRINAEILVTFADSDAAEAVDKQIREVLSKRGARWNLELIADRPPMSKRKATKQLFDRISTVAKAWNIPLKTESSVWPSVAGLAPASTAVLCGVGPVARNLYTPDEAVQRLSLIQRTLLLAEFLVSQDG
jgi:D-alanine-D-alanine ligase